MPSAASAPAGTTQNAQLMGVTFSGTTTLAHVRSTKALNGTPVTATLNGTVVGTGTLDANGHAVITFTSSVPRGSTLLITAGSLRVTVVLAKDLPATTVLVTVKSDGSINIQASGDGTGTGNGTPSMSDNDAENMDEDSNGSLLDVDNPALTTLPSNLPITIVLGCGGIVISPNASGLASIRVREQVDDQNNDDDSNAKLDFRGAFTGPLVFPVISGAARLRVEVFSQPDEQGPEVVEVRAPISAITSGAALPSACPSPVPSATPSASATATPAPSATM